MFERLNVGEIGSVGFIITPIVRHNLYKIPDIFNKWTGSEFDIILKSIQSRLRPVINRVASARVSSARVGSSRDRTSLMTKKTQNYTFAKFLTGHTNWVNAVSFGSSGQLASGSQDGTIKLWDTKSGGFVKNLNTDQTQGVRGVKFNKEGTLLVTGSDDGKIMVWNVESSTCLHTLTGHESVFSVTFSHDSKIRPSESY